MSEKPFISDAGTTTNGAADKMSADWEVFTFGLTGIGTIDNGRNTLTLDYERAQDLEWALVALRKHVQTRSD